MALTGAQHALRDRVDVLNAFAEEREPLLEGR